ncbi:MAG: 30S ribosomal protein S17 [Tenericutes bacterium]|nr:30S ribosomal protein S17 [Mycoplasmatota bacterium]
MENTINRRVFTGTVVSAKNNKTISVLITTYKKHPLYSKRVISSKKFTAHDEKNEANTGDVVKITECRPLSKTKKFRLIEIVEKHQQVL